MEHKGFFNKETVQDKIFDTGKTLRLLINKYENMLEMELVTARANQKRGKKSASNYSQIGIVYYSLGIVYAALDKLTDIQTDLELSTCMNQLSNALKVINDLNKKAGKLNPDKIIQRMKKMTADAEKGSGSALVNTLDGLSKIDTDMDLKIPIDQLVSVELIEKLINGESLEDCLSQEEGMEHTAEEFIDTVSIVGKEEGLNLEPSEAMTSQELDELIKGL